MKTVKRFLPLFLILVGMGLAYGLGLGDYLSFETLKNNREALLTYVEAHKINALLIYAGVYTLVVVFSIPGASFMTIAGGFLFGYVLGTSVVVLAATVGSILLFLAARTAIGDTLKKKAGRWFQKMETGFQKNQFNYLLTLRLIPLFPFFVVNVVPAFFGMKLLPYSLATFLGIIPGSFVYVSVGVGLGSVFETGATFSIHSVLTPQILLALSGLALLSAIPLIHKIFRRS